DDEVPRLAVARHELDVVPHYGSQKRLRRLIAPEREEGGDLGRGRAEEGVGQAGPPLPPRVGEIAHRGRRIPRLYLLRVVHDDPRAGGEAGPVALGIAVALGGVAAAGRLVRLDEALPLGREGAEGLVARAP